MVAAQWLSMSLIQRGATADPRAPLPVFRQFLEYPSWRQLPDELVFWGDPQLWPPSHSVLQHSIRQADLPFPYYPRLQNPPAGTALVLGLYS